MTAKELTDWLLDNPDKLAALREYAAGRYVKWDSGAGDGTVSAEPPRKQIAVTITIHAHDTLDLYDQLAWARADIPHGLDEAIDARQQTGEAILGNGVSFEWLIRSEGDYTPKQDYDAALLAWRDARRAGKGES